MEPYDSNGNLESDARSGIAFVIYDISNLPVAVYTTSGISQVYGHDVNGARIRKYASNGTDTYYVNDPSGRTEAVQKGPANSIYTYNINAGGETIGQVMRNSSSVSRYYYLKDHLGSVRVIVNTSGAIDSYNDFYPYGMLMPGRSSSTSADVRFKFTGKERDVETGWDSFGARGYDARIGKWLGVDPMAEKYPDSSPYNYCSGNPLRYVDPTGRNWGEYSEEEAIRGRKLKEEQTKEERERKEKVVVETAQGDKSKNEASSDRVAATEVGIEAQNTIPERGLEHAKDLGVEVKDFVAGSKMLGKALGLAQMGLAWNEYSKHSSTGNLIELGIKTAVVFAGPEVGLAFGILDVSGTTHEFSQTLGKKIDDYVLDVRITVSAGFNQIEQYGLQSALH